MSDFQSWDSIIRRVPDYPKPGILFYDLMPIFSEAPHFQALCNHMGQMLDGTNIDAIAGIEARGFILGAALAQSLNLGFIPIRKKGKLPPPTLETSYTLEYGSASIEMPDTPNLRGKRVALVDDLLATGGTSIAAISLLKKLDIHTVGFYTIVELAFLDGRAKLLNETGTQTHTVLSYESNT